MSGLKRKEEEIGLVDLSADQTEKSESANAQEKTKDGKNRPVWMALAGIMAGGLLLMILGTLLFHISLVTAGFVVVIEAVIAVALNNSPLWVHIGIMAAQVVIGFLYGHVFFLVFAAAYYFTLLLSLKLFELEG